MENFIKTQKIYAAAANRRNAVHKCLKKGLPNKRIARQLNMSVATVEGHITRMCRQFNAKDSIHLMTLTHPARGKILAKLPQLTAQENEILHMRMRGTPLKDICQIKGIAFSTGETHMRNIRSKTDSSSLRNAASIILQKTPEGADSENQN